MLKALRFLVVLVLGVVFCAALAQTEQFRAWPPGQRALELVATGYAEAKDRAPVLADLEAAVAEVDLVALVPATLLRARLDDVAMPPARAAVDAPAPAALSVTRRTDLTVRGHGSDYVPEPDQGRRHITANGVTWWGWGPDGDAPRPVVIALHGAGRDGESMVDIWRETAEREGIVIVAPDFAADPGWDLADPDPRRLVDALDAAAALWAVDRDRVALFGHSRGGMAAQRLANAHAGPWRAVAVHAGTLPAHLMQGVEDGAPILHMLGSVDRTFPLGPAREAAQAIAAKGHPYELMILEGHNHWLYAAGEGIADAAWDWLAPRL